MSSHSAVKEPSQSQVTTHLAADGHNPNLGSSPICCAPQAASVSFQGNPLAAEVEFAKTINYQPLQLSSIAGQTGCNSFPLGGYRPSRVQSQRDCVSSPMVARNAAFRDDLTKLTHLTHLTPSLSACTSTVVQPRPAWSSLVQPPPPSLSPLSAALSETLSETPRLCRGNPSPET